MALQLQALWARLGVLPTAHAQAAYIKAVIVDLLKGTYGRMLRILKQAEIFNDLTSADWAPKICACLNAAHYLEHALREAAEQLPVQQRPEPQQQYWQQAGQEQEQQEGGASEMGEATRYGKRPPQCVCTSAAVGAGWCYMLTVRPGVPPVVVTPWACRPCVVSRVRGAAK